MQAFNAQKEKGLLVQLCQYKMMEVIVKMEVIMHSQNTICMKFVNYRWKLSSFFWGIGVRCGEILQDAIPKVWGFDS